MPQRGRPPLNTLTDSQARILRDVELFLRENSFSPTVRELAARLGMAGPSVIEQLQRLERNGYIKRQAGKARSLTVLRTAEPQRETVSKLIAVPIVGRVAAGMPILSAENICGEVLVEEAVVRSGIHFALEAHGRSMINAGIYPKDIVIMRQQQLAESGDIVAALLNDDATLKRLHYSAETIELRPENPKFRPIVVGPNDDLRILGKLVGIWRPAKK